MTYMKVMYVGENCPNCGGGQFSISSNERVELRPLHWDAWILGEADCRSCQQIFLIRLSPNLEDALRNLLNYHKVPHQTINEIFKVFFY